MKAPIIFLFTIILFSCSPTRNLQGTWKMIDYPELNSEIDLQIDKKEYTFSVNGKETKRIGYKFENKTIISDEIPIVKHRDSIEVVKLRNDTLTLILKEMGRSKERTFTRMK